MSSLSSPASTASSSSSTSPSSLQGYGHRVLAVLGGQWGDEGKGKLVDILAQRYDVIARFNGGSNAGHTLVVGGKKFAFHLLPCGLLYDDKQNVVGNGVVLHLPTLFAELEALAKGGRWDEEAEKRRWVETGSGRLLLSNRAHLLFDFHQEVDGLQEKGLKADSIGTTKKGIGPCYASKATRNGIRVGELLDFPRFTQRLTQLTQSVERQYGVTCDLQAELARYRGYAERIRHMVTDTAFFLHSALREGRTVLAEGANAALLDLDHGTYPYVTSSSTTAGGVCTGLGVAPRHVTGVLGVVKAYTTPRGQRPLPHRAGGRDGRAPEAGGRRVRNDDRQAAQVRLAGPARRAVLARTQRIRLAQRHQAGRADGPADGEAVHGLHHRRTATARGLHAVDFAGAGVGARAVRGDGGLE